jgi:hypothetical protein
MTLAIAISAPAFAQTSEADCTAMFVKVDADGAGSITGDAAKPYLDAMTKADMKTDAEGTITAAEFATACESDTFKGMAE